MPSIWYSIKEVLPNSWSTNKSVEELGYTWEALNSTKDTTTMAWWFSATKASKKGLYVPMPSALEVVWETLPVEDKPVDCPVIWKLPVTMPSGAVCLLKYTPDRIEKTTMPTTSIPEATWSTT